MPQRTQRSWREGRVPIQAYVTIEEREIIEQLTSSLNVSISELVRTLIRNAEAMLGDPKAPNPLSSSGASGGSSEHH